MRALMTYGRAAVVLLLLNGCYPVRPDIVIDAEPRPRIVYEEKQPAAVYPPGTAEAAPTPTPAPAVPVYPDLTLFLFRNTSFYTTYFLWRNPTPEEQQRGVVPKRIQLSPGEEIEIALPYGNHIFSFKTLQPTTHFKSQPGPRGRINVKSPGPGCYGLWGQCFFLDDRGGGYDP